MDKNFAVHLPVLDRLFGTQHLPADEWPDDYGIHGDPVPEGYARQLAYPFVGASVSRRRRRRSGIADDEFAARPCGSYGD